MLSESEKEQVKELAGWIEETFPADRHAVVAALVAGMLRPTGAAVRAERFRQSYPERKQLAGIITTDPLAVRLSEWRKKTAKAEKKKAHHILHNRTIAELVEARPASTDALRGIFGLGPWKLDHYGADLLRIIQEHESPAVAALSPTGRPLRLGPVATAILSMLEKGPLATLPLIAAVLKTTDDESEHAIEDSINRLAEIGKIRTDKRGRYRLVKIAS